MKLCDYCGCENSDNASHCCDCGTNEFVAAAVVAPALSQQRHESAGAEVEPEFPEVEPDIDPEQESALCPACLFPNVPDVPWCKRCGSPIGPTAGFVPTEAIFSVGCVYRGALRGHPKPLVVCGIWLIFFPGFLLCASRVAAFLFGQIDNVPSLLGLWLAVIGLMISGTMLYRITRNYFSIPNKAADDAACATP
jgi:hypothetical protein